MAPGARKSRKVGKKGEGRRRLERVQPKGGALVRIARRLARAVPLTDDELHTWVKQPHPARAAEIRERLDQHVVRWDDLVQAPMPLGNRRKFTVIFLHVPKTGGTTLEYVLGKNYGVQGTVHINNAALTGTPEAIFAKGELAHCIMGHHTTCDVLYRFVDRPLVHMTVLREPVGRLISYYNYLSTARGHAKHESVDGTAIESFAGRTDLVELENAQTLRVVGQLRRRRPSSAEMPGLLEIAKETLRSRMSLVGVTDRFDEFLLMGQQLLSWPDVYYRRHNVSGHKVRPSEVPDDVRATILERNRFDAELYAYASGLFDERCREIGLTAERLAAYRERNLRFVALLDELDGA